MPNYYKSSQVGARLPALSADHAGDVNGLVAEFVVPTGLAVNDVIEMGVLPAGSVPVAFKIVTAQLDTNGSPTIAFNAGYMTGTPFAADSTRTVGADFVSGSVTARTGGIQLDNVTTAALAVPSLADRSVGITLTTGAATLAVGAKLRLFLSFLPTVAGIDAV